MRTNTQNNTVTDGVMLTPLSISELPALFFLLSSGKTNSTINAPWDMSELVVTNTLP